MVSYIVGENKAALGKGNLRVQVKRLVSTWKASRHASKYQKRTQDEQPLPRNLILDGPLIRPRNAHMFHLLSRLFRP
jgi:hypothetical protein